MEKDQFYKKGRGAQINPNNRFNRYTYENEDDFNEEEEEIRSKYIAIHPKTIVNKVISPDVGMDYSLNPYQGCEHGCTYCYARPTHEYWGYSPGIDFEQTILYKPTAPDLLKKLFTQKNWTPTPIVLSGNTDCYQPCEAKFRITRQLLEVFLAYKHPVGIITKNVLIKRDLDLISELAKQQLIAVNISFTTLNEELRRKLEPRTATAKKKLQLIEELTQLNVPVRVMASPIIPALNDHEILPIAKATSACGANYFHAHPVRLMGANEQIFEDWLAKNFPDRKQKVMNQIKSIHNGKTGSSSFGNRMKGNGEFAANIRNQRELAKRKYFNNPTPVTLRTDLFQRPIQNNQLRLF